MNNIERIAITRQVSQKIGQCELTHLERQAINVELARRQHRQYEEALAALGCQVHSLPAEPELPDSVFVEDTAVVLDELAIISRPGADSRKSETVSIARVLGLYRQLYTIESPGTMDGGDVLCLGKTIYAGLSSRSNQPAVEQMMVLMKPYGYMVKGVEVSGCLHLKSAVTQVAEDTLLINPEWVEVSIFKGMYIIEVDPSEPYSANALLIGNRLIYPSSYPRTRRRLEEHGLSVTTVDVSELIKAEGAVTCCSLVFNR
jgi:dimethylargininase